MRHWKPLLATAIALACVAVYLGMPKIARGPRGYAYVKVMMAWVWDYRRETGDYPRTAREVVDEVGPRVLARSGLKVSLVHGDRIRVEGPKGKGEIQYYYVSPDTPPTIDWPVE